MEAQEKSAQERLLAYANKLETHNISHGKNVVFWSCKMCNPEEGFNYHLPKDCFGDCLEGGGQNEVD